MKRKLLSIFVCLGLLVSFCALATPGAMAANPVTTLNVYVQYADENTPTLVHGYSQSETAALTQTTSYYKGWNTVPNIDFQKGSGFTLTDLVTDLKKYDPSITFNTGANITVSAPGFSFHNTYDFLYGSQRYYYPNLKNLPPSNDDESGGQAVDAMFAIWSTNSKATPTVEQSVLDLQTMSDSKAYRFLFGQTYDEAHNQVATTPSWVQNADTVIIYEPYAKPTLPVPELAPWILLGTGLFMLVGLVVWKKRRSAAA